MHMDFWLCSGLDRSDPHIYKPKHSEHEQNCMQKAQIVLSGKCVSKHLIELANHTWVTGMGACKAVILQQYTRSLLHTQ